MVTIHKEEIGTNLLIRLDGRFDAAAVEDVRAAFKNATAKRIVVNLAQVSFLDSSALGLIVFTLRRQRENGLELILCCLSPQIKTIFELTRLYKVVDIYESEELALEA